MTFDATMAQLDQILQADRQRKEGSLALLRSAVQALEGPPAPWEPSGGDEAVAPRRTATPERMPFVPMPKRTTHGGRFGPTVVARIRAAALAKR